MDLEKLKVFYRVAKHGGFTKAGHALNITQPTLIRSVNLLEHSLKTKLFNRSPRGVTLTSEGERLFEFAQRFINEAETMQSIINDKTNATQGQLKIVTTPHMGSSWLMTYLNEYFATYPEMKLAIMTKTEKLDLAEADVAICTNIPHHPNLIQKHLKSFPMGLWASSEYLEQFGTPQTVEDLDHHRIIAYTENIVDPYGNFSWILTTGVTSGQVRKPHLIINTLEGLINASKHGIGIAELSEEWPSVKESNLINLLPHIDKPVIDLYYIYKENTKHSKRINSLLQHLEQKISENTNS